MLIYTEIYIFVMHNTATATKSVKGISMYHVTLNIPSIQCTVKKKENASINNRYFIVNIPFRWDF